MSRKTECRPLDRELIRTAGEHLGTLAEQAKEQLDLGLATRRPKPGLLWSRYAHLANLSKSLLELANAD